MSNAAHHESVIFRDGQPPERIEQKDSWKIRARIGGVRARDLVAVESGRQDTILVRPNVILTNVGDCRALITKDSLTMIDMPVCRTSGNPCEHIDRLLTRQDEECQEPHEEALPFEFRALDAVLEVECNQLRASVEILKPEFFADLQLLTESIQQSMSNHTPVLLRLLSHNKRLFQLEKEVCGMKRAVEAVLMSDEDMAQMYLTDFASDGKPRSLEDHTEAEVLFEQSLYLIEELEREVLQLKSIARETEEFVNINLNSQRNAIMTLSLKLNMGMLSTSVLACVAGVFGMNLSSGLEDANGMFIGVTASAVTVTGVLLGTLLRRGRMLRLW
ncbi:hypothetical protein SARC_02676 [Sphaeroforma arctica JP610]|uniref:Magnesium transporter n=1 Tax=Sphaeroforma arctica JP610 TaxID=667725 RepID=A0A0L0G8C0_9EUKA|nr:hypothetical protein SARC_02676 [Sphaeroforma arctica JP610]KNC85121.1 hypothetical protein SARC_02676 [Sphaeroforma arctica JP610]|eukprot:XP_014159023.1 hypothetical protein SARC_02676 [Sphaeroforma arctica JP610]